MNSKISISLFLLLSAFSEGETELAFETYLTRLIEKSVLSDSDLRAFADRLNTGALVNPIQSNLSTVRAIHKSAIDIYLMEKLDLHHIHNWLDNFQKKRRVDRQERHQTQEETKTLVLKKIPQRIFAGNHRNCAIDHSKKLVCWGDQTSRTMVPPQLGPVLQITQNWHNICVLMENRTVECWDPNDRASKFTVPNLGKVQQISGRCALEEKGTVQCWKDFVIGEKKPPTDLGPVSQISADWGYNYACAVELSGKIRCWGNLNLSQAIPRDLEGVVEIVTTPNHLCTLDQGGAVRCWDHQGELETPKDLEPSVQISSYGGHTCALTREGKVQCWGSKKNGQIDVPEDLNNVLYVSAGLYHTCVVLEFGTVRCWGGEDWQRNTGAFLAPRDLRVYLEEN